MPAGEFLETGNVIGVGKKADIEDQIAIGGNAVSIAEAGQVDHDLGFFFGAAKLFLDEIPELVDRELGSVDGEIGQAPDGRKQLPLQTNALGDGLLIAERMWAARFTESPRDGFVVRFQEQQAGGNFAADTRIDGRESLEAQPFANIHYQGGETNARGVPGQLGEFRDEPDGQVVHRVIAEIFKNLEDRSFARAAQTGDDHQLRVGSGPFPAFSRIWSVVRRIRFRLVFDQGLPGATTALGRHSASGFHEVEMTVPAPYE